MTNMTRLAQSIAWMPWVREDRAYGVGMYEFVLSTVFRPIAATAR